MCQQSESLRVPRTGGRHVEACGFVRRLGVLVVSGLALLAGPKATAQNQHKTHYTNNTGEARDCLEIEFNQGIQSYSPNPMDPFQTVAGAVGEERRIFTNAQPSVADGQRIPATGDIDWVLSGNSNEVPYVVCARWGVDNGNGCEWKNAVALVRCKNTTGKDATKLIVTLYDKKKGGSKIELLHTSDGALTSMNKEATIDLNPVVSSGSWYPSSGWIQLTTKDSECPKRVQCEWKYEVNGNERKAGSSVGALINNDTSLPADGLVVTANLPISSFEPANFAPFTQVSGLGTTQLTFSGGTIPAGEGMDDQMLVLSSDDEGPVDIDFVSFAWSQVTSSYCTAGTTASGCRASMGSTGAASLSNTQPFELVCSGLEGGKNGIFFYGISGRVALPWGAGSTSYLCVKSPTQRTPVQNSGGTGGACDGFTSLDWNAYLAANPGNAIHQALSSGSVVGAQAWFRDPGSPRNTSLSNALEFVVGP